MTDLSAYRALIASKRAAPQFAGFGDVDEDALPDRMFDHQRHGAAFALRAGRSGLFYDTGLGKTGMELVFGHEARKRTGKPSLMLCPLAVAGQHAREAVDWGIDARVTRDGKPPAGADIGLCNYEMLHRIDPADWGAVVLDESSILKSFAGKTSRALIDAFAAVPYRLSASATPAPNDHTEIGQQSAFLGVMESPEMLSRWFIADQMNAGRYRLKKPAIRPFWDWVASWARCVSKPSDLGFSDAGFEMPPLRMDRHIVRSDQTQGAKADRNGQGTLFRLPDTSATSIHGEKRLTADARAGVCAALVAAEPGEPWVVWVETDYDAQAFRAVCEHAVEVSGSMPAEMKEERLAAFSAGEIRVLLTKPSIAGFGLNWQHCARTAFMGLSFSYEAFYQALRRFWRFRQQRQVVCHVVCGDTEEAQWRAVSRKAGDHDTMKTEMAAAMLRAARSSRVLDPYFTKIQAEFPAWLQ